MARYPRANLFECLVPAKNRSIAPPFRQSALPLRLSPCHPRSREISSSCGLRITIIFSQKTYPSETRSPTSSRPFSTGFVCAPIPVRSLASPPVPMSPDKSLLPLVAVVGPTASGKSALGVWLAERLGGEVVACDSTQLYRGFDIGTAKPSITERHGVPHHLIDVLAAEDEATAGGYRQMAIPVLEALRQRGRLPIFTVGTGLYLRALLEGLADVPQRSEELRERLRRSAREHGPGHLHRILSRLDGDAAQKISAADEH